MQSAKHSKGGWGDGEWVSPQTPQVRLIQQTRSRRAHHTPGTGEHLGQHLPGQKEDSKTGKSGKDGLRAKESWGLISGVSTDQREKMRGTLEKVRGREPTEGECAAVAPTGPSRGLGAGGWAGTAGEPAGSKDDRAAMGTVSLYPALNSALHTQYCIYRFQGPMRPCAHCTDVPTVITRSAQSQDLTQVRLHRLRSTTRENSTPVKTAERN